jgi:autotransporter-associated beta strand protein
MKTSHTISCRNFPGKLRALAAMPIALLSLAFAPLVSAQQTYTWDNETGNNLWGNVTNWVGDPSLTFNNQTDLIFDNASVVNTANAISTDGNRTIRSITINADFNTLNNATFDIRTRSGIGGAGANLTFAANTGNASFTIAQSTSGTVLVRLGQNNVGSTILNTNLDLAQNNTFINAAGGFQFSGSVSGNGTINKTGAGLVTMVRDNVNWTGGMNINEGEVSVFANGNAMGTGTWTLGGGANNTTFSAGSSLTYNNAGGLVVAAGAGTRTIINADANVTTGNPVLNGNITLNNDAIFAITQHTINTHDRLTANGTVTGTGGIVKTGTGILILSGAGNDYSGATDIQGGKFYLGGAGRLGSGAVTISNGANLDFGTGAGQTNIVSNNISGAGEIIQSTAGTETRITGNVTSTGGLTIENGTLRIGNGGTTGSYTGDTVINGGALAFARSNAYTHGGTISGAGTVSKVNDGTVTLTGNNSYSGNTGLFTGVLEADNANALGTGNIVFNAAGGGGTLRYTANSAGTDWASRIVNSGAAIRLDTAGNNVTLAGIIDSSNVAGLVKSGTGTLTLGGDNTYSGATTADAGVLAVNGNQSSAAGAVTISTNATLAGSGTIGGATTINGRHNPGNSPGVQTFNSGLTYATGSTLVWELTANTESGRGTSFDGVNVAGGVLSINAGVTSDLVFNAAGSTVNWNDSFWGSNRQWQIFDNVSAPTLGSANVFDTINVSEDSAFQSLATVRVGSGFSWEQIDSDVYLNYTIPEPSTYALLALGAAGLGAHVIRRRQRR